MHKSAVEQATSEKSQRLALALHHRNCQQIDRMFVALMAIQWIAGIGVVLFVSPWTWIGERSLVHTHLWAAAILGGIVSSAPIYFGAVYPGNPITRHVIAIAQALWGALLIHLTGGRIETHFHVFGSLAFIAFYRDWKVLLTMTVVVAADHAIRGIYFPLSVYGVVEESPFRWLEHALWVVIEDIVLVLYCIRSRREAQAVCDKQAELEQTNQIVEQKVHERSAELEDTKSFLQSIIDSIEAHICVLDENGKILETNAGWNRFATKPGNSRMGKGLSYIDIYRGANWHSEDKIDHLAHGIDSVVCGESEQFIDQHSFRSASVEQWFQIHATPLKHHQRGAAVVAHFDITQRVQAQNQLIETSEHLNLLSLVAQYTDNAVVITDSRGKIEWVNAGFERITGYNVDEIKGKSPGSFLQGPNTDPETAAFMRNQVINKKGFDVEIINYTKWGTPYWVAVEVRPIHDEQGELVKFIAIESDISEKKDREFEKQSLSKQLQEAARQAGMAEVATGILHNVGNVLNSVNVSANVIKDRLDYSVVQKLDQACDVIEANRNDLANFMETGRGQHLPRLLRQIANSLRQESISQLDEVKSLTKNVDHIKEIVSMQQSLAKKHSSTESVAPADLFEDAIKIHQESLERHCSQVIKNFQDAPEIRTNRHEVIQILVNLIKNAQQAVRDNHEVERSIFLNIKSVNEAVCFEVIDTGIGISKTNLKKIFQHGFTTKKDGHGFGLHASANTANSLGGSLSALSDGLGKGTTFKLTLPLSGKNKG